MVRKKEEQEVIFQCVRNGIGEAEMHKITRGESELYGKGKLVNHLILPPGTSIGEHVHEGDNEIYYILAGTGLYNDNGKIVRVFPGDTTICSEGELHGLVNDGREPLEAIALILYS